MKYFLLRLCRFCLPLILYGLAVAVVDPYNYFNLFPVISNEAKMKTAFRINSPLWQVTQFCRRPCPNLLLGDSRMHILDPKDIKAITGEEYFKFTYSSSSLPEITHTLRFAANKLPLKNVYIGLNFNQYNWHNSINRVPAAIAVQENPLLYFTNSFVLDALVRIVSLVGFGNSLDSESVVADKSEYWKKLPHHARKQFGRYKYPENEHAELRRFSEYCRQHQIHLVFIIFPTHIELQQAIAQYSLTEAAAVFKQDLSELAETWDFDYENEFTRNMDNYDDPVHFTPEASRKIIKQIWGGEAGVGKPTTVK